MVTKMEFIQLVKKKEEDIKPYLIALEYIRDMDINVH